MIISLPPRESVYSVYIYSLLAQAQLQDVVMVTLDFALLPCMTATESYGE